MLRSRQIAVFGVPVRLSLLWLLAVAGLLVVTVNEVMPGTLRDYPGADWTAALVLVLIGSALSVAAHEVAHLIAVRFRSDEIVRIDPAALTALPDTDYFPQTPSRDALVALAGPAANALLGLACFGMWLALDKAAGQVIVDSVLILAMANGGLALLGLMPGYPFDGARALRAFVWYITGDIITATKVVAYYGYVIILAGLAIGVFMVAAGRIFSVWGVWVLLTIWMCNRVAIAGITELFLIKRSESLRVDDIILGTGRRIPAEETLEHAVEPLLETHGTAPSLVVEGREAIGLIDLDRVRKVPRAEWRSRTVRYVMEPLEGYRRVDTSTSLRTVFESLPPGSDEIILLERSGRIVGAASRDVITEHLREYLAAERLEELRRS